MTKSVLWIAVIIAIVDLTISVQVENVPLARSLRETNQLSYNIEVSKIDAYRQRYYDVESEIWSEIKKSENAAQALRKIHQLHLAFYADQMEYGVDLGIYETGEKDLVNEVKFINDSVSAVRKNYLHKNERNFARNESIELAGRHREFIRAMDAINNITKDNDFFGTIKQVNK